MTDISSLRDVSSERVSGNDFWVAIQSRGRREEEKEEARKGR